MISKLMLFLALAAAAQAGTPVVLELFTSEGCASCPPADELFAKLVEEPDVIGLAYHVDYWNKLGWTDPFSKADWSRRQGRYSGAFESSEIYTPQLIAGGRKECVGSDEDKARAAIADARQAAHPARVKLTVQKPAAGKLAATASFDISGKVEGDPAVALVLFEDGLEVDVKAGENAGSKLAHQRVVRALVEGTSAEFALEPAWKVERLGVVALVQDAKLRVLGAALARP